MSNDRLFAQTLTVPIDVALDIPKLERPIFGYTLEYCFYPIVACSLVPFCCSDTEFENLAIYSSQSGLNHFSGIEYRCDETDFWQCLPDLCKGLRNLSRHLLIIEGNLVESYY